MKKRTTGILFALTGCALSLPQVLQAEETGTQTAGETRAGWLEEIVVSVRKRSDNIQDIPISVQAFSSSDMRDLGINDINDVANFSPSVIYDQGAGPESTRIGIRGLMPSRGRQNVAVLVDGIDVGTEAIGAAGGGLLLNARVADIERIEVVKGPQSALFGRSAFAGAIQYVTKDPSEELESSIAMDLGSHGRYNLDYGVSGSVIENVLGVRLNANYWSEEGFHKDEATRSYVGGGEGMGLSLTAKWTPTEALSFKLRSEYSKAEYDTQSDVLLRANTGKLNIANDPLLMAIEAEEPSILGATSVALFKGQIPDGDDIGRPQLSPNPFTGKIYPGSEQDIFRTSLIGSWDKGPGTITSYTSYTNSDGESFQDSDGDADLVNGVDMSMRGSVISYDMDLRQISQELRFSSDWDSPVQLTFGALYWNEESEQVSHTIGANCTTAASSVCAGLGLPPGQIPTSADLVLRTTPIGDPTFREVDHQSYYGMVEWQLSEQFKITAETRYNREDETVISTNCDLDLVATIKGSATNPCEDPLSSATASMFGPSTVVNGFQNAALYGTPIVVESSSDWWTPRFTAEWAPNDDMMFYLSAAKGVKPAGTTTVLAGAWFDVDFDGDIGERTYEAEKMWAYELGAKLTWNNLRANMALFFQDYTDKQVTSSMVAPSGNIVPIIENAGQAEVWGFELETTWYATENLSLGLGYTYLDTEYTEYSVLTDSASRIVRAGNCAVTALPDGSYMCMIDLSGNELEKAPEHSVIGKLAYHRPLQMLPNANFSFEMDVIYQAERYISQESYHSLDSYSLTNLRLGLQKDNWRAMLYVDNLFDDDTVKVASPKTGSVDRLHPDYASAPYVVRSSTAALSVGLPDPRTFGLRVSMDF